MSSFALHRAVPRRVAGNCSFYRDLLTLIGTIQERDDLCTGAGAVDAEGTICHAVGNSELTAKRLVEYALEHHKIGVEGQTMVIIDECQIIFNCRDFGRKDRGAWVTLFSQHRKLNNYSFGGLLISLTGMTWFVAIEYWYGGNKLMLSKQIFAYHKKYSKVYDSYKLFSDMVMSYKIRSLARLRLRNCKTPEKCRKPHLTPGW